VSMTTAERAVIAAAQTWVHSEEERRCALGTPAWRSRTDALLAAEHNLLIAVRRLPLGDEDELLPPAPPAPPAPVPGAEAVVPSSPILLTIAAGAVVLDVSPARVRQLVTAGALRMHVVDGLQHVERDQVVDYAVERRRAEAEHIAARVRAGFWMSSTPSTPPTPT
jgi:hypothetical protein